MTQKATHSPDIRSTASFEVLFRTHYQGLLGYAQRYVQDPAQADEVVQEVFAQLWEKRHSIQIESSLKSYLFRAVHNHCLNWIKHQKVREGYRSHVETTQGELALDETDSMVVTDIKESILAGIAALPPQCAKIFRMNRLEGYKYREIAEELGLSMKTVEAQMAKAMRRMRVFLKDHLPIVVLMLTLFLRK